MDLTSTPFISYADIKTDETDIYDDAWGFVSEFSDVVSFLGIGDMVPGKEITDRIIDIANRE